MKRSQSFAKTTKTVPNDETSRSAKLLLQAGFIHKELAGVYDFLPLGMRVLENIMQVIREEMDALGAEELRLTALQNKSVWESSGRWDDSVAECRWRAWPGAYTRGAHYSLDARIHFELQRSASLCLSISN